MNTQKWKIVTQLVFMLHASHIDTISYLWGESSKLWSLEAHDSDIP
jgi:hypothetical protein